MKHKTPPQYITPLRSKSEILAFLKIAANARPQYGLFAFNVKVYRADLSFANLVEIGQTMGEIDENVSACYLAECQKRYDEENLYNIAIENARNSVVEDDLYRMMWDGSKPVAEWSFEGRSGGWLVLQFFEGLPLTPDAFGEDDLDDLSFLTLRRLYRFIVQCLHDFRPEAVRGEIEHQASFILFQNLCTDIETDKEVTKREARERAETLERLAWEERDVMTVMV